MAELVNINIDDTKNLLSYKSCLRSNPSINFSSTNVSSNGSISDVLTNQKECSSFKAYLAQSAGNTLDCTFNFGDALQYTCERSGNHCFSFFMLKDYLLLAPNYSASMTLKVYVNSVLTHTFTKSLEIENLFIQDYRFAQSFDLVQGNIVNFSFEFNSVGVTSFNPSNPNILLFFTGFQLNYGRFTNYQLPRAVFVTNKKEYIGTWDYANTLPAQSYTSTPIYLNNNGLGTNTNKVYKLKNINELFNVTTNSFDFTLLELGDRVDIRFDLTITTTSANQNVKIFIEAGIGDTPYEILFLDKDFKSATTHTINFSNWLYIGNNLTKDNPCKVKFISDANANILVNGWATNVIKRK